MSQFKEGDVVWYGPNAVTDVYVNGAIDIQGADESDINTFEEYLIPHTENLAAVARVLAAHPQLGEAVQSGIEALHEESANAEHWRGIRDYRITDPLEAAETLKALAAALNGGGE